MRYQEMIAEALDGIAENTPPRQIEAYMRDEYGTLDHLSKDQFRVAAYNAVIAIRRDGPLVAEQLTRSYGL